jgi:hypothetical protein
LPTFAVQLQDRYESGPGDVVTVTDDQDGAQPRREEQRIAHAAEGTFPKDLVSGWLIAFETAVRRDYPGSAGARLARWPVGNLQSVPSLRFGVVGLGGEGPGADAQIDDLVSVQCRENTFVFPLGAEHDEGLSLRSKQVELGLYLGGGEALAVVQKQEKFRDHDLVTLVRGAMGTAARDHSSETSFWLLEWPLIHVVEDPGADREPISLREIPAQGAEPDVLNDGYVAVDLGRSQDYAEVLAYTQIDDEGLERPRDVFGNRAFRSAFGSGRYALRPNTLLIELPYRFHDRAQRGVRSFDGVFLQVGRELPGSRLQSLDWSEHLPNPYCEVRVLARADGAPTWDDTPATAPGVAGGLYVFSDPMAPNQLGLRANRIELRVVPTYKPRAFYEDGWKQGAVVSALRVRYRQATRTLRREER